ncbi:MAG: hypothetical protein KDI98_09885 [Hyphomicrobiaceae bacterium]|nr:hypothetical protein [Hyphomicrobiaceae bacterium]
MPGFLSPANLTLLIVALAALAVLFWPRLSGAPAWRATVTPLASIIGSGFLIAGPILYEAAGPLALAAMAGLCAAAFLYGSANRYLITAFDPLKGTGGVPAHELYLDKAGDLALALAYFVSVAYYLNLLAAFGLRLFDVTDEGAIRLVATGAIALIGIVGAFGGLKALERLEVPSVAIKLAVIAGLIAALGLSAVETGLARAFARPLPGWDAAPTVLGLLILVQGFETSRYLDAEYDAPTRVRTMFRAQVISTLIYLVFILLGAPFFEGAMPQNGAETAIIDMLRPLAVLVGPMLILAALASQFSAAIADAGGAGGLIGDVSGHRIPMKAGTLATALAAAAITWSADIFQIVAYASRAFVLYYGLTALIAVLVARRRGDALRMAVYGAGIFLAVLILVFAEAANA